MAEERVDYLTQIKPLLQEKCYSCHGVLKQEGNLRLETLPLMQQGGDSGAVISAGNADDSLLLERVAADEDYRMPPADEGAALKPDEIELLRRWIKQGANAPEEKPPAAPNEHWAFVPIERPPLPNAAAASAKHPIDRFLAAAQQQAGLQPLPKAERTLLLRRLYLDLIGLPPTFDQLQDNRSIAEIADELLASAHYGERWGRHWMDILRYSDWYGLGAQLRYSQKHMWHWRDWLVKSFNDDKGYDRMILEMIAGDEIDPTNPDVVAGTGFLARNYYLFNRTTWLDSTIEHTGKAFLGLTLNCAKCHDHKYDPLSHVDYYQFRAIFEPHQVRLDPVPGTLDFEQDGLPRVFDDQPDAETFLHLRGNPADPDPDTNIEPRVPALLASFAPKVEPVRLPAAAYAPVLRDHVQQDLLGEADQKLAQARTAVEKARQQLANSNQNTTEQADESSLAEFRFSDSFDAAQQSIWQLKGDGWKYQDGTLQQTIASRERHFARLQVPLPRDFDATCEYTHTGGTTYKSVTFRFDESADGQFANYVYTSAHEPGPKVQVAYTRNGSNEYPSNGRAAKPIRVGERVKLRFAVRDRLVNVWLNDEFVIAYLLPDARREGSFSMSGFDATVSFDSLNIQALAEDTKLKLQSDSKTAPVTDPKHALHIAEVRLDAATKRRAALEAILLAEEARLTKPADDPKTVELKNRAALAEAEALIAEAKHDQLVAGDDEKLKKSASSKLKSAQQKLATAQKGEGSYQSPRVSRKALETPAHKETDYPPVYSPVSTGRRTALAKWMTDRKNPLTARVAVNHVWTRHFGEPLVDSMFDFGLRTKQPLHAELLDFLAAEFMENGWSFKHLHRLIVTSEAWQRQTSTREADPQTLASDPANRYYWRANTRRMESQIVRDSLLSLSGTLDPSIGGPSLDADKPSTRRSIYFKHSRDDQNQFLTMFDDADLLQCYRRSESIVPQQALALANSRVSMQMAETIAAKISSAETQPSATSVSDSFIRVAFFTLLARQPSPEELAACEQFCVELKRELDGEVPADAILDRVRTRLIHSLLNHNDFISIR
ncbi:MAG: hypothetical protein Fues2KO_28130 [Fuerstiella sp.]